MPEMRKCLRLNLVSPTATKVRLFRAVAIEYLKAINLCKDAIEFWDGFSEDKMTRTNLHKLCYGGIRKSLPAQLAADAITDAWMGRKDYCARISEMAVSFNVPRSGNLAETDRKNPVVRVRLNGKRIAIPVQKDGAWRRFQEHIAGGWGYTQFRVGPVGDKWILRMMLRKEVPAIATEGTVGVDVGSAILAAVSVVDEEGTPSRQLYFGQDIAAVQQRILAHRSRLQAKADKGSGRAAKALRRLKGYEQNFTKTRCHQVAHQVVSLCAGQHSISIENLSHLRDTRLNRAANRIVKRLPYHEFRAALESVAGQSGIPVVVVPAENTSRTCSRCGHIAKESRHGSLYRCVKCGFTLNADRNASVNIARRGLSLERLRVTDIVTDSIARRQTSSDGAHVTVPVRPDDGGMRRVLQTSPPPQGKPRSLDRG